MTIERRLRKDAKLRIKSRFRQVEKRTIHASRCYEEWYEIWETKDGSPVTNEDIEAFKLRPRGQGHAVIRLKEVGRVQLNCVCDSGD